MPPSNKKAYTPPQLTVHGTVEQITEQRQPPGLPPGKIPSPRDARGGIGRGAGNSGS